MLAAVRHITIRRQILVLSILTASVAVLVSLFIFYAYNLKDTKRRMVLEMSMLAQSVGRNNTAAIRFGSTNDALLSLGIFRSNDQIEIASLFYPDGSLMVEYFRNDIPVEYNLPVGITNSFQFSDEHLEVVREIEVDGIVFGYMYLRSNLDNITDQQVFNLQIALVVLLAAISLAVILSAYLERPIAQPIRKLAGFARTVGELKDYSLRIQFDSTSVEIDHLFAAFNNMMRQIQEQNHELQTALDMVSMQKEEIYHKNLDIQDSINSARRLQDMIFPRNRQVLGNVDEMFVFFRPKDTLSGDFYWYTCRGELAFFATVDCVGHGVPGALLSIVAHNLLTKFIVERGITDPAEVLTKLDAAVRENFMRQENRSARMMDLALYVLNSETGVLNYAGANSPLYVVRNGQLQVYRGDKAAIGTLQEHDKGSYTTRKLQLEYSDMLYTFSDGFVDQFGGVANKKFKYTRFRSLLLQISSLPAEQQRIRLEEEFGLWCGPNEQVDDVLVMGVRVPQPQSVLTT